MESAITRAGVRARLGSFLLGACVTAVALTAYLTTMCRTYGPIDKGELAAVATTLGIAHPTGYPTLTLLGHFCTRISPLRPVLTLNVLASLLTALGAGMMALVFAEVLRLAEGPDSSSPSAESRQEGRARRRQTASVTSRPSAEPPPSDRLWLGAVAALFVAFSTTWWSQATGFEVYALHAFLLPLVTLLFLRYLESSKARAAGSSHWPGTMFSFALGLAFTNHMSTIMLAPAFLFLFIRGLGWSVNTFRSLLRLVPAFLVGLLPYAYLPVRASMDPRLNWGDPSTWDRFLEHVSGAQFRFAMFYAPRVFGQQTAYLFNTLLTDTAYMGLLAAAAGIVYLMLRRAGLGICTLLLFLTCLVVSGLYDINDIGNYHLAGIMAVGVGFAASLVALRNWVGGRAAAAIGLLLAASNVALHFQEMNESRNFLVEDLTRNVLGSLPENAVVFSNDWDYWTSGSMYAQEVDGLRRDVLVLDPESLRAEWYLDQLAARSPDLMVAVESEANAFRDQIRRFERARGQFTPLEAEAYFQAYYAMIGQLIERNAGQRPFFVTEHVDPRIGQGWQRLPIGPAYRLTKETAYHEQPFPRYAFRPWTARVDAYVVKICELYTTGLLARARYEESHGQPEKAREYGLYALSFDPQFREDEVPDFPLHIDEQIKDVLRNYRELRERAGGFTR